MDGAIGHAHSVAPIVMTIIKVVLMFTLVDNLNESQKTQIKKMVSSTYCREMSCSENELDVSLCNGSGSMGAKYDVVLAIKSDKRILNEGLHRDIFRKDVAKKLSNLLPKNLGFQGRVSTFDGIPEETTEGTKGTGDPDEADRSKNYVAVEPRMTFDMLQLYDNTREQLEQAHNKIKYERELFKEWGLEAIMPNPVCALSFYGAPGTGKTLAADALASKLKKKIIRASYADIESKYHGEGPKNVNAIFQAAEKQDALLFIDEADSLLSKRLTNVTQGSEQAINSMRSQILICLERFHGIVVFATNFVVNYDDAFLSRLISVEFKLPDAKMRERIWRAHLYPNPKAKVQLNIPLGDDIDLAALSKDYEVCGRDIRNAVIDACVAARSENSDRVYQSHLVKAIHDEIERNKKVAAAKGAQDVIKEIVEQKVAQKKENSAT